MQNSVMLVAVLGMVFTLVATTQAGLIAHWKMDGAATDAAGSFDATPVNSPGYAGGLQGLDGPTSLGSPAPAGTLFIIR